MRHSIFNTLFFLLTFTPSQGAGLPPSSLYAPDESCRMGTGAKNFDPFEEPIRFASGGNEGKCVHWRFRRARIQDPSRQPAIHLHSITVANVLHNGRFMIADIPAAAPIELDILFEEFLPAISHVALRFHFAKESPVQLRSQSEPFISSETHDLLLSAESALPKDGKLELLKTKNGSYLLNYGFITIEEATRWMVGLKKHHVRQYRLHVPAEALPRLLSLALHRSEKESFQSAYDLMYANCATAAFALLDEATGSQPPTGSNWLERAWPVAGSFGTLNYLTVNGLIAEQLTDLEKEGIKRGGIFARE